MTRRACSCCGPALGRRSLLAASGLLAGSALLSRARAEDGTKYEAMLLTCIDPRFVTPVFKWMDGRGLDGKYSRFGIAGAGVGAVAPQRPHREPEAHDPHHDQRGDHEQADDELSRRQLDLGEFVGGLLGLHGDRRRGIVRLGAWRGWGEGDSAPPSLRRV